MGEQGSTPGWTANAAPGVAAEERSHPATSPRLVRNVRTTTTGILAACAITVLAACGSPASSSSVAVPGGADLTVGAPERSATDPDDAPMAAGAASSDDEFTGDASDTSGADEAIETDATEPRPAVTSPRAAGRTARKSGTSTTRKPATPSTRQNATTAKPTSSSGSADSPTTTRTTSPPLTLGPGAPTADEAEVIRLMNVERVEAGCHALAIHPLLTQVARAHSQGMSVTGGFKHNSQDGRTPFQRLTAVGYDYLVAGENIAAGQPTPAAVMRAWLDSPEHKANILDCRFSQIGVGKAYVAGSQYGTYWTQNLATPM